MNMKKRIKLIKKNFYFAIVVVALLFIAGFVIAAYDAAKASHETLYTDIIEPKTGLDIVLNPLGNVGIGTTNPNEELDVIGDIRASGTICDSTACIGVGGDTDWVESGGNIYRETGNVGIGTTNPGEKLTVAGTIESTSGGVKFPDGTVQTTAGGGGFGNWESKSVGTTYTAASDGFVIAYSTQMDNILYGYTPSTTLRIRIGNQGYGSAEALIMPVRGGDTWRVTDAWAPASVVIWWLPIGG